MKIDVCFEVGDTVQTHDYPIEHSWSHENRGITIRSPDGRLVAWYITERVICVRPKAA